MTRERSTPLCSLLLCLLLVGCGDSYRASKEEWDTAERLCWSEYGRHVIWISSQGYAYCGGKHHVSY